MRVFFYVKIYAFLSVSINHIEYFKGKYGILYTENILRKGVQILQESAKDDVKICRVSENIFCFWLMEPVELELYIQQLKEAFRKKGEEENLPFSFSIGAIYNNTIGKENIDGKTLSRNDQPAGIPVKTVADGRAESLKILLC